MKNKTIGRIILKGGSSEDLRREFPEFPLIPTKDYFCELGYKESTAKQYLSKLRSNDNNRKSTSQSSIAVYTPVSEDTFKPISIVETTCIESGNIDYNNLIIDTCALIHREAEIKIQNAKHVTFINSTIEEMDRKKKFNKNDKESLKKLSLKVREYTNKILLNTEKYMLSTFSGLNDERYPDNILLQYILILPKQIRPTLLTADKNLVVKAEMWGLPYILVSNTKEGHKVTLTKETPINESQKLARGLWVTILEDRMVYIENKGTFKAYVTSQDGTKRKCTGKIKVESGDEICILVKMDGIVKDEYYKIV